MTLRKFSFLCALILFVMISGCSNSNNSHQNDLVDFSIIIQHFKEYSKYSEDRVELPLVHKGREYGIEISNTPVYFEKKEIILKNPFDNKYPVSFSVIYQNRFISLFEQGIFVCHIIPSMQRDEEFEKEINTKNFDYHWIIGGELVGRVKDQYFSLNSENKWIELEKYIPLTNQPKLFEDDKYIAFCDCHGEFGGTVYFYNKLSEKLYFTGATCANSILKKEKYFVLSHLGHIIGVSRLKSIGIPDSLSMTDMDKINKMYDGEALGYTDKSTKSEVVFDYSEIQLISSFFSQERTIYMAYWRGRTFLAEIENNTIRIINPLFNDKLYTNNPITTVYNNIVLINLGCYGSERNVSYIMIYDKHLIKLDWKD